MRVILTITMSHYIRWRVLLFSWPLDKAINKVVVPLILQKSWGELQPNFIFKWVNIPILSDLDMHLVECNFLEFLILFGVCRAYENLP
jgi:hypothetical protein